VRYLPAWDHPNPTLAVWLGVLWTSLADTTAAASLGLGTYGLPIPSPLSMAVALTVVTGIALATIRADRDAAILWLGFVAYGVSAMGLIAARRAGVFGSEVGLWLRYGVEPATFLLLVAMLAASPLRIGPRAQRVAVGFAVLVAINLQMQSHKVHLVWDLPYVRGYVANLRASLEELRGVPDVVVLDHRLPEQIIPVFMRPYDTSRYFLSIVAPEFAVAGRGRATHEIGPDGRVKPIPR
jgi:hypothetical protein